MTRFPLKARLCAAAAMALALGACNDNPPAAAPPAAPAPLAVMDAGASLPYAPPTPVRRDAPEQGYRWAERAYGVQRAVYDVPPDYGFDYGDEESLAWETADHWSMYAEPRDDGYRYYYYEPGAAYPYFVRDDDYGYGYNAGGVLVAVFDSRGRYLSEDAFRRAAPVAGRYYARGRDLRNAGLHARRVDVDERTWAARAPQVTRSADPWLRAARDDRDWSRWREADRSRELDRFNDEQARRGDLQRARLAQEGRPDDRRQAEQRLGQDQARAAEQHAREAAAREAEGRQRAQQAEADRRAHDQRQADQVQRADVQRRQQAEHQARQAQAERQRQAQALAAQAHARQGLQAEAQRQQQVQQAQRQQQQQAEREKQAAEGRARQAEHAEAQRQAHAQAEQKAQAQQQARAAEQQARAAAAREHGPKAPGPAAAPPAKKDAGPRDHGLGHDKEKKDHKD